MFLGEGEKPFPVYEIEFYSFISLWIQIAEYLFTLGIMKQKVRLFLMIELM